MAAPAPANAELLEEDKRRLFHAVYRIYTECSGMKLLGKRDIPEEKYFFLGRGPEDSHFIVGLTYNYGVSSYDIGTGFGHFAIATQDVYKMVEDVKAKGGTVTREPGPVKGGTTVIAFVKDPDGYIFELIQPGPTPEPLCQGMPQVGDWELSIKLSEMAFGVKLPWKKDNPEYKVAISTDDVYKSGEVVKLVTEELVGKITRQPGPIPGINTKITTFLDPDGRKTLGFCFMNFEPHVLHWKMDIPEEKYSNALLGFGPEESHFVVELTDNYGVSSYDIGTGFGHFAISTQDVYEMVTPEVFKVTIAEINNNSGQAGWWLDSGATVHVCKDRSALKNFQAAGTNSGVVVTANKSTAKIEGQGSVELNCTSGEKITLPNVLYVPELSKNLISVHMLCKMGLRVQFEDEWVDLWKKEIYVGMGVAINGMYRLSVD